MSDTINIKKKRETNEFAYRVIPVALYKFIISEKKIIWQNFQISNIL